MLPRWTVHSHYTIYSIKPIAKQCYRGGCHKYSHNRNGWFTKFIFRRSRGSWSLEAWAVVDCNGRDNVWFISASLEILVLTILWLVHWGWGVWSVGLRSDWADVWSLQRCREQNLNMCACRHTCMHACASTCTDSIHSTVPSLLSVCCPSERVSGFVGRASFNNCWLGKLDFEYVLLSCSL